MVMKKFTESALFKFGSIAGWFYLIIFASEFLFITFFTIAVFFWFYYSPSGIFDPFHLFYLIDSVLLNAGLAAGLLLLARHLYFPPKEYINESRRQSIIKTIILYAGFIFYIICTCAVIVIDFYSLNSIF